MDIRSYLDENSMRVIFNDSKINEPNFGAPDQN